MQRSVQCRDRSFIRGVFRKHFGRNEERVARDSRDSLAENLLNCAGAVHLGRIDVRHAQLDPTAQRAHCLGAPVPAFGDVPRALADDRHRHAGTAERFTCHWRKLLAMTEISYLLFDVFAEAPFSGNQLAVASQHLPDETMQRVANELNIAETVFLKQTNDPKRPAELRIFTPGREVPFAGHPTVGATFAIAEVLKWVPAGQTEFVLGERVGDVAVRVERKNGTVLAWL